ncbi:hypothetical protein BC936DRAFT_137922, partial [Jimgerdemannia flammicorona]
MRWRNIQNSIASHRENITHSPSSPMPSMNPPTKRTPPRLCHEARERLGNILGELGVLQLRPYLVWISPDLFTENERLGQGGFSTVYRGILDDAKVKKLALNVLLIAGYRKESKDACRVIPTAPLFGLTKHPGTHQPLMAVGIADNGTLGDTHLTGLLDPTPPKLQPSGYTSFQ